MPTSLFLNRLSMPRRMARPWLLAGLWVAVVAMAVPSAQAQQDGPDVPESVDRRIDRLFQQFENDESKDGTWQREEPPEAAWRALQAQQPPPPPDIDDLAPISKDQYRNEMAEPLYWFGPWSLLPAVIALSLAFATKNVLLSLFAGIVSGAIVKFVQTKVVTGLWVFWELDFIGDFFLPALGTTRYAQILLVYLWFLGGIIGVWGKTGAAKHFAEWVGSKVVRGPKTARLFAWIIGVIFHQGGTVSTVLAGTTVRPVSDKHKISHEELSYIVDSTASPVATVLPFNAWPAYVGGLMVGVTAVQIGGYTLIPEGPGATDAGVRWFFNSILYNFYGILAVTFTLLFSLGLLPWVSGKMRRAIDRSRASGDLDGHAAEPLIDPAELEGRPEPGYRVGLEDFLVPLGLLLGIAILPKLAFDLNMINQAFLASTVGAVSVAVVKGMPLKTAMDGYIDGCKNMTLGAIILGLAVTLGQVSKDLNTAGFVVGALGDWLPAWLLPALLTLSCMIIAFAVGSSWSTYAVIVPLTIPLALYLAAIRAGIDPETLPQVAANAGADWQSILFYVHVCFGAVIGGAVFGDQCSPISDTTVLSSMFTGCDLMDHVTTQAPLALVAAGLGAVLSTLLVLVF